MQKSQYWVLNTIYATFRLLIGHKKIFLLFIFFDILLFLSFIISFYSFDTYPRFRLLPPQVKTDYLLSDLSHRMEPEVAIQLGVLELRHFLKDMPHANLDKKSTLDYLEREVSYLLI